MKNTLKLAKEVAKLSAWTYVLVVVGSATLIQLDRTAISLASVVKK